MDFIIEVINVVDYCYIFYMVYVIDGENIFIVCGCYKYVGFVVGIVYCDDFEIVYCCLKCINGVDFGYYNVGICFF